MARVVVTDQSCAPALCAWLSERHPDGAVFDPRDTRTIGHVQLDGERPPVVLGVVALNRWTVFGCEATIAGSGDPHWGSRELIRVTYDYVFRHADKHRLSAFVRTTNAASIRLQEGLGHTLEARLADWFGPDQDALLYRFTRREWLASRWYRPPEPH